MHSRFNDPSFWGDRKPAPADAEILGHCGALKLHVYRHTDSNRVSVAFELEGSFGPLSDDDEENDATGMEFARRLLAEFSKAKPEGQGGGCCE